MTTFSPPATFAATTGTLGNPYIYLDSMVLERLAEKLDLTVGQLVVFLGDLSGSGSDTGRIRNATGFGWARRFSSMGSETAAIVASSWEAAYDSISIGRKGLAFEETWQRAILQNDGITLQALANSIADSWLATLRYLICVQGATFATNAADDTATFDVDDAINLRNLYENTAGFTEGSVVNMLHTKQMQHLKASMRTSDAFKYSPDAFAAQQAIQSSAGFRGSFLGMDWFTSTDVVLNTDYYGFSYVRGALGFAVASTARLATVAPDALLVPQYGLAIKITDDDNQATSRVTGNAWLGVTSLSPTVAPQYLLRSNAS